MTDKSNCNGCTNFHWVVQTVQLACKTMKKFGTLNYGYMDIKMQHTAVISFLFQQ